MQLARTATTSSSPRHRGAILRIDGVAKRRARDQAGIHDAWMRAVGRMGTQRPGPREQSSWVPAVVPKARFLRDAGMTLSFMLCLLAPRTLAQTYQPSAACRVADSNIVLDLYLPLSKDGSGNAARGMRGELQINHQKMPGDRRRFPLDDKLPAQFWNVGNEFRVRLLLGLGETLVDLAIETQRNPQSGEHTGIFRLQTAEGVKVQGRLTCQVD